MGERLPPLTARAVHICVDMQRLFSPAGPWSTPWMPKVLPQCVALSAHCPDATIFTRFITPRTEDDARGAWRALYKRWPETTQQRIHPNLLELMPELARFTPPARVFDKPVYSGFAGIRLVRYLEEIQADVVILSGAETDICVLSTALGAVDYGYHVVIATDAVCSSSDAGHDALLKLFHERFSQQISGRNGRNS